MLLIIVLPTLYFKFITIATGYSVSSIEARKITALRNYRKLVRSGSIVG